MNRRELIALLAGTAVLGACGKKMKLAAVAPGNKVLAFGDSVTYGTGADSGEGWPTLLAGLTGWSIENAGVPGDTAEAGKARLQALLDEQRPVLVIVEIGGNDFLRRRSPKAVKDDLRSIIRTVKQTGAQVVLVAVPELSLLSVVARKPTDSPIYRELGDEEQVPVIDDVFSAILGRPELCADQIHPNALGYRKMADGMHAALKTLGLSARH